MLGKALQQDLQELIEQRDFHTLKEVFSDFPPPDIAEILDDIDDEATAIIFRLLPRDLAAQVFEHLSLEQQEQLIQRLTGETLSHILNEMAPDDRTALLEELPVEVAQGLLRILSPEERRVAKALLGYPEESVGRLMTPDFVAVRADWTIADTFQYLRRTAEDRETLNVLYVLDEEGKLVDDIKLRQIVLASPESRIADLMDGQYVALRATDDQEEAVEAFKKYDRVALPVLDSTGRMVGIVTVDDVLDVAEEEATEDIHRMGGVESLEEPYFNTTYLTMLRKRAIWLVVLFLGQQLTANALRHFEEHSLFVSLTIFLPLIISSGGNSGSQAASLIIRGLAVREMELADWWRVFYRETLMGVSLGAMLGALGVLRALWGSPGWVVPVSVGLALILVVTCGTFFGSMLPFALKRFGFDPAVSSAPFISSFMDVTGIMIYFSISLLLLKFFHSAGFAPAG